MVSQAELIAVVRSMLDGQPRLGVKAILARIRAEHPLLAPDAGAKEVRSAMGALGASLNDGEGASESGEDGPDEEEAEDRGEEQALRLPPCASVPIAGPRSWCSHLSPSVRQPGFAVEETEVILREVFECN